MHCGVAHVRNALTTGGCVPGSLTERQGVCTHRQLHSAPSVPTEPRTHSCLLVHTLLTPYTHTPTHTYTHSHTSSPGVRANHFRMTLKATQAFHYDVAIDRLLSEEEVARQEKRKKSGELLLVVGVVGCGCVWGSCVL